MERHPLPTQRIREGSSNAGRVYGYRNAPSGIVRIPLVDDWQSDTFSSANQVYPSPLFIRGKTLNAAVHPQILFRHSEYQNHILIHFP